MKTVAEIAVKGVHVIHAAWLEERLLAIQNARKNADVPCVRTPGLAHASACCSWESVRTLGIAESHYWYLRNLPNITKGGHSNIYTTTQQLDITTSRVLRRLCEVVAELKLWCATTQASLSGAMHSKTKGQNMHKKKGWSNERIKRCPRWPLFVILQCPQTFWPTWQNDQNKKMCRDCD